MPKTIGALLSLSATGKIGGHRRGWTPQEPAPPPVVETPEMLPHISGQYYTCPQITQSLENANLSADRLYLLPFLVPTDTTYDRIGIRQTSAGTPNIRLGIYGPIATPLSSLPLLLDTGTIISSGNALQEAAISQPLAAGWYCLAVLYSAVASVYFVNSAYELAQLGYSSPDAGQPHCYAYEALSFAALPNPSSATPSYSDSHVPAIFLRAA